MILAILNLCHCDASHQVSAQSDLWFGRRCRLKIFKMASVAAILDIGTETILAILNLYVAIMPPTKFQLNVWFWRRCRKSEKLTMDGRTMDKRPWHKLTWSKAQGELKMKIKCHLLKSLLGTLRVKMT